MSTAARYTHAILITLVQCERSMYNSILLASYCIIGSLGLYHTLLKRNLRTLSVGFVSTWLVCYYALQALPTCMHALSCCSCYISELVLCYYCMHTINNAYYYIKNPRKT